MRLSKNEVLMLNFEWLCFKDLANMMGGPTHAFLLQS